MMPTQLKRLKVLMKGQGHMSMCFKRHIYENDMHFKLVVTYAVLIYVHVLFC